MRLPLAPSSRIVEPSAKGTPLTGAWRVQALARWLDQLSRIEAFSLLPESERDSRELAGERHCRQLLPHPARQHAVIPVLEGAGLRIEALREPRPAGGGERFGRRRRVVDGDRRPWRSAQRCEQHSHVVGPLLWFFCHRQLGRRVRLGRLWLLRLRLARVRLWDEVGDGLGLDLMAGCTEGEIGELDGTMFRQVTCAVGEGSHRVESDRPLGLTVYGYYNVGSYAYPGGSDLEVINPVE